MLLLNFGFGVLTVVFLSIVETEPADPGARSLALPFIPLTIATGSQIVEYYVWNRYDGHTFLVFPLIADLAIVGIAFSWNYLAVRHYRLNGIHLRFWFPAVLDSARGIIVITTLLAISVTVGILWFPHLVPWTHAAVFAFLFYAAFRGLVILRHADELLPSSRTAAVIASISFVIYPLVAYGDLAAWNLPFLDPTVSFWVQAHPVYMTVVMIPAAQYIYRNRRRTPKSADPPASHGRIHPGSPGNSAAHRSMSAEAVLDATWRLQSRSVSQGIAEHLTSRENQIVLLLYEGYRYREIAEQLAVSLATVRTHVHHIYGKLGVSRREELFLMLRAERS